MQRNQHHESSFKEYSQALINALSTECVIDSVLEETVFPAHLMTASDIQKFITDQSKDTLTKIGTNNSDNDDDATNFPPNVIFESESAERKLMLEAFNFNVKSNDGAPVYISSVGGRDIQLTPFNYDAINTTAPPMNVRRLFFVGVEC